MIRSPRLVAGGIAVLFLALHLPVLPRSLEDLDSINFALGVRTFDVARHQPHPPGYPIFILAAKAVHAVFPSDVGALSLLGVIAGALATLALFALFQRIDQAPDAGRRALLGVALTVAAPLFWFTAARPLSDMTGLAAAVAVQAMALGAASPAGVVAAVFCAGLAAGIRSQVVWLTLPAIVLALYRQPRELRFPVAVRAIVALAAGGLLWAVPLVWLTGGPAAYWSAIFRQGAEDLSGVTMLWTTPTVRQFARTLYYAFVAPWGPLGLAVPVLIAAAAGFVRLGVRARSTLLLLGVAFAPYLAFDILFQETVTTRYALPVVIPVAFLAVCGLEFLPRRVAVAATIALALTSGVLSERVLLGYSRQDAPSFRLMADMSQGAPTRPAAPIVLAMHRREDFDLRRPMLWTADRLPSFERIAAPPKHEWLEVVKYWNRGGRAPVWFLADPLRSDLSLFDHRAPQGEYRWSFEPFDLMGGVRPSEADWYVVEPPRWYLGEGWAVTPETAGVAREDGRGPSHAPITGWIRRENGPVTLMIGGRNLSDNGPAGSLRVAIDGQTVDEWQAPPGFFLKMLELPAGRLSGAGDYATLTIASQPAAADIAVEQFDAQPAGEVVLGFGDGWNEAEYNPTTGKLWRWTTERATLRVRGARRPLTLVLEGETETFRQPSRVVVRVGQQVIGERSVGRSFAVSIPIPAAALDTGAADVTIETDQTYVPAETRWRSRDRRRLGLKIFDCRITPS